MKICQEISQEKAKMQSVINQFKELAEKVKKVESKEEMNKLQSEFARLKVEKLDEYIKQQPVLKALSMNFQGVLEKELGLKKGGLAGKVKLDKDGYLIKFEVPGYIEISNLDLSYTKIKTLKIIRNSKIKKINPNYFPKTLESLDLTSTSIDFSDTNFANTSIKELIFNDNFATPVLKKHFLPSSLEKLSTSYSSIEISDIDFSDDILIELNIGFNKEDIKKLNPDFLPRTLRILNIDNGDIWNPNSDIYYKFLFFFEDRKQEVKIIH